MQRERQLSRSAVKTPRWGHQVLFVSLAHGSIGETASIRAAAVHASCPWVGMGCAKSRQRSSSKVPIAAPISQATNPKLALSGGNNLASARSFNAFTCPSSSVLHRRPAVPWIQEGDNRSDAWVHDRGSFGYRMLPSTTTAQV